MNIYNSGGTLILNIEVDDTSYANKVIMGDNNIVLYFALADFTEIPIGAYCDFQGARYTLKRPSALVMRHTRNYEYTVTMESAQDDAKHSIFRNPVDGRIKFPLTATPREHLQMFVDNMNRRGSGWTIGSCIESTPALVSYDKVQCYDALGLVAQAFKTEYEIIGTTVSLCKIERNKATPLVLSYGRDGGLLPGVGRSSYGDKLPIEVLFVQGGDRNIDRSTYGSGELLLPAGQTIGFDGEHFEGETGYDSSVARQYVASQDGLSVCRNDKALSSYVEDCLDCSDVYPKRVGKVSSVVTVDASKNFYDIVDSSIPAALNYNDYLIAGESMTIVFQTGQLAGREFDVKYFHDAVGGKAARRFEIVPQEIDGVMMPNSTFIPVGGQNGDEYAIFGCTLPAAYIRDDNTKTGASWDMFKTAVRFLYDNEEQKLTITGEIWDSWSKKNWAAIGSKITLGGYVSFQDNHLVAGEALVRITGVKTYINNPNAPVLELSNETVSPTFVSELNKLEGTEVVVAESHKDSINYTKRRYRDAMETMRMLEESLMDNFTESVSPVAVRTMQLIAGDESLQFRFVNSLSDFTPKNLELVYDSAAKILYINSCYLQHMTLGITTIKKSHSDSEYKAWSMSLYSSGVLSDGSKSYYLYAKVDKSSPSGQFVLSETAIGIESVTGYYHLLVGILNSEYDDTRSFAPMYGFSEIVPGRITTDRISSADGNTYFDLVNNVIAGKIKFLDGIISGLIELGNDQGVNAGVSGSGTSNTDIRFWAGSTKTNRATAPFRVQHNGKMFASDAEISGKVSATSGTIGGFEIGSASIEGGLNKRLTIGASPVKIDFQALSTTKTVRINGSPRGYSPSNYTFDYYQNREASITPGASWQNLSIADLMSITYVNDPHRGTNYGYQYAMLGNGHLCLDGIVEGCALDVLDVFDSDKKVFCLQMPFNSNRIAVSADGSNNLLILPDILSLMSTIGVGTVSENDKKCSFRFDIVNTGSNAVYVAGSCDVTIMGEMPFLRTEYPALYYNGSLRTSYSAISLGAKKMLSVLLVYDGTAYFAFVSRGSDL